MNEEMQRLCDQMKKEAEGMQAASFNIQSSGTENAREMYRGIQMDYLEHMQKLVMQMSEIVFADTADHGMIATKTVITIPGETGQEV